MKVKWIGPVIRYLLTSILAFIMVSPIIWTLLTSLKIQRDAFQMPPKWLFHPTLGNYAEVLVNGDFFHNATNSLIVVAISTIIAVIFGSLTAYGLARFRLPGRLFVAILVLVTRFVPPITTIIPLYLLTRSIGLYDSRAILILCYSATNIPYVIWMMWSFFNDLPVEVEEAAMLDGCSRLGTFWRVVLRLSGPGLAATAVLATIFSWNEFLTALTLTAKNASTLPLFISTYIGDLGIDWPHMTASGILVILPALIVSMLIQKQLARGMTFGAVKA